MERALDIESQCQSVNLVSADATEAMAAFGQKREPHFKGR
jgi:hypothetical protein